MCPKIACRRRALRVIGCYHHHSIDLLKVKEANIQTLPVTMRSLIASPGAVPSMHVFVHS